MCVLLPSLCVFRLDESQRGADPGLGGDVDLQHGAVCGGRGHGADGGRLPDPPGPHPQEEEARLPEAAVQR